MESLGTSVPPKKCSRPWCTNEAHREGDRIYSRCLPCKTRKAELDKTRKAQRIAAGRCTICNKPLPSGYKEMGIHEHDACAKKRTRKRNQWRRDAYHRKSKDLCGADGCKALRYVENGRVMRHCFKHLIAKTNAVNELREARLKNGLCPRCGNAPEPDTWGGKPVLWCRACRAKNNKKPKEASVDADAKVV